MFGARGGVGLVVQKCSVHEPLADVWIFGTIALWSPELDEQYEAKLSPKEGTCLVLRSVRGFCIGQLSGSRAPRFGRSRDGVTEGARAVGCVTKAVVGTKTVQDEI